MRLEVKYWPVKSDSNVDTSIDNTIEIALKPLGFERWASGFAVDKRCRDLAFDQSNKPNEE